MKLEEALKNEIGVAYSVNKAQYINLNKELFYDTIDSAQQINFETCKKGLDNMNSLLGEDYKEFEALFKLVPEIAEDFEEYFKEFSGGSFAYFSNVSAKDVADMDVDGKLIYFIRDGVLGICDDASFSHLLRTDVEGLESVLNKAVINGKKKVEGLYS